MTDTRTIFMIWRPWLGALQTVLAERLYSAGFAIHLYAAKQTDVDALCKREIASYVHSIKPFQILYDIARTPANDEQMQIERAALHEKSLGVTYGSLCVSDRHLGRGFAVGGPRFPRTPQSRASRAQMLAAVSSQIEFWQAEFELHRPQLALEGDIFVETVAKARSTTFRTVAASRHKNSYYWARNNYYETPDFQRVYEELLNSNAPAKNTHLQQAYAITKYWQTAMKTATVSYFIRNAGYEVARRAYYKLKGRTHPKTYELLDEIRFLWRRQRHTKLMTSQRMIGLEQLNGKRFVFFPLATEPEVTLQGLSPEYFFQLETIAAIARDLPADVLLAVKEHHPACGMRDALFYEQIWNFKNVVFLDMRENGPAAIAQAAITITIAGSAGFEAASMGKPTIVMGHHNIYSFLPHVRHVTDIAQMGSAISDALGGQLASDRSATDGARFLDAVESCSFDLETFDPFAKKPGISHPSAEAAIAALRDSLPEQLETSMPMVSRAATDDRRLSVAND